MADDEIKTIKYPFAVTIREFCHYLDKRDIKGVDPISIVSDETGTTISYKSVPIDDTLRKLFGPSNRPISDRLISSPAEPSELEKKLWDRANGKIMCAKGWGQYWTFVFDDNRVLTKLVAGRDTVYHRSLSAEVGGQDDAQGNLILRFFQKKSEWEFNVILLGYVYPPGRSDDVAVSGCQFYDLELNEEPVYSCCSSNEHSISWMVNEERKK